MDRVPKKIVHLWSVTGSHAQGEWAELERFAGAQELGLYSLLRLVRAAAGLDLGGELEIVVVSDHIQEVDGTGELCPHKSTILAAARVIPQEYPYIVCRCIDLVMPQPGSVSERRFYERLSAELVSGSSDPVIAYRDGHRWVQTFEPVQLPGVAADCTIPGLRKGGVYLITGGLGGLGFTLAAFLAENFQAKLVLTGRSPFPARQEWAEWLSSRSKNDRIAEKIRKIEALEESGAEIMVFSVDAADRQAMAEVVSSAEERFGTVNGVIHAAGILDPSAFNLVSQLADSDFQDQFRAKVYGLFALAHVFEKRDLDFCLLTSSLSPILGGLGFAAYAAANQFMDAFVSRHNRDHPGRWIGLNWGDWQPWPESGQKPALATTIDQLNMTPTEGLETFRRILYHCDSGRIIVSSGDLQLRIDQWVALKSVREEDDAARREMPSVMRRSHLSDSYVPASTPLEQGLADIWQRLFGFERIGSRDDFFELGGDSLKAITLAAKIHKELKMEIPLGELFLHPTIEQLAQYIEGAGVDAAREADSAIALVPVETREYYPLSSAQKRLFIIQQLKRDLLGYNEQMALRFSGKPDTKRLERAFAALIGRHESLRTSFLMVADEPVQKIHDHVDFEIEYYNYRPNRRGEGRSHDLHTPAASQPPLSRGEQEIPSRGGVPEGRGGLEIIHDFIRPFDLAQPPLFRVGLIEEADTAYILIIDMHHIVFDGTSMVILLDEVAKLYAGEKLPALPLQYRDFSAWQQRMTTAGRIKEQEAYWLRLYADAREIPRLDLPGDFPRPRVMTFAGHSHEFRLAGADVVRFKALAADHDATLFMNLLAVLNVLLHKYSGHDDIVVGSGILGRPHADLQPVIGMFVNTLALRNHPAPDKSFGQFLKEVRAASLQAYENQAFQFEDLVEKLNLERDPSRHPLFDVCFAFQNFERPGVQLQEIGAAAVELKNKSSRFDITLFAWEQGDEISFKIEYYTGIFKKETIGRLAGHLENIVKQVAREPNVRTADIDILSAEERQRLLVDFNDTASDYPCDQTIGHLFAAQVEKSAQHIAVIGMGHRAWGSVGAQDVVPLQGAAHRGKTENVQLTYRELDDQANRLAHILLEKGVRPDTIVALLTERSIEMIAAILGILKSGGAYLPIELGFPAERIAYMLKDSGSRILVVGQPQGLPLQSNNVGAGLAPALDLDIIPIPEIFFKGGQPQGLPLQSNNVGAGLAPARDMDIIPISEIVRRGDPTWSPEHTPSRLRRATPLKRGTPGIPSSGGVPEGRGGSNLAYIIYTSGTTGKPKGVLTMHYNVTRVVRNTNYIDIKAHDRVLQLSNYAFDGSVFDIYGALLNGAALVLVDRDQLLAVDRLAALIRRDQVSLFFVTTALFNTLVDVQLDCFSDVRKVLFGGERVSVQHCRKALDYLGKGRIVHVYGPTETTVYASFYDIDCIEEGAATVPIGAPIANTTIYILDKHMRPAALGAAGEVYIGGMGTARGYLNNPELTDEKFITAPAFTAPAHSFQPQPIPGRPRGVAPTNCKLYKTGDLARWLPDGNIEFLGRIDSQVKLRGFRIELAEIESVLLKHEQVKEALVTVSEGKPGDKLLCAYIVKKAVRQKGSKAIRKEGTEALRQEGIEGGGRRRSPDLHTPAASQPPLSRGEQEIPSFGGVPEGRGGLGPSVAELREYLSRSLPGYMIPAHFVVLDALPLTANGKIDRKVLPAPGIERSGREYAPPSDEVEQALVGLWSQVLGIEEERIGIDDDFFQLGGHSLRAATLMAKIRQEFNVVMELQEIFEKPTIRETAAMINVIRWAGGMESGDKEEREEIII